MNLSENCKVLMVKAGQSAGTDAITTDVVDMAGYREVVFLGSITTKNAANFVNLQEDSASTGATLADLAGRRLYSSGKASTPEYALNHLLERAGVQDVDIQWKSEHAEVLASLLLDPEGAALLPQPFVAAALRQNPDIRVALDLNALWEALGEGPMITGVTVARAELIERHPERLAAFLKDYAVSVDYVNTYNEEAAQLMERFGIISAPVALDALPFCGITLVTGAEMARALQAFYQAMFTQDPRATGGSLPDEAFYYLP